MNTLSDTDEGRARPSVWPVYVAAAVVGVVGLTLLGIGIWFGLANEDNGMVALGVLHGLLGGLGVVAAWGLFRLRLWAWWCAVVWTIPAAFTGFIAFDEEANIIHYIPWETIWLLLVWPLVARRHLFFPPKPEGEE